MSILRQEVAFFDKNRTGELINRLSADSAIVGRSITDNLSDGLRAVAQAVAGVSMMVSDCLLKVQSGQLMLLIVLWNRHVWNVVVRKISAYRSLCLNLKSVKLFSAVSLTFKRSSVREKSSQTCQKHFCQIPEEGHTHFCSQQGTRCDFSWQLLCSSSPSFLCTRAASFLLHSWSNNTWLLYIRFCKKGFN